jgi:hypothetical protein
MWRPTWKGMWSHKRRLLGTTMAVLLGVAFLTTSLAVGSTMTAGFDDLFSEANAGTDVVVRNSTVIGSGDNVARGSVDAELVDEIDAIPGVLDAVPIIEGSGRIVAADGSPIGGGGPPTTAANWAGDSPVNPWALADGRAPVDVAQNEPFEVVIDRASATTGDLHVGDQTVIQMPEPVAVTQPVAQPAMPAGPQTYAELIEMARLRRDILVVTALEQSLRPISMTEGRLEVALVEGADPSIIQTLSARLKFWTGRHWMVSVSTTTEAAPTIREVRDQRRADETLEAKADPLVQAILAQFPGAELRVVEKIESPPVEAYLDAIRDEDEDDE